MPDDKDVKNEEVKPGEAGQTPENEAESTAKGIETLFERVLSLSQELEIAKTVAAKEKTRADDLEKLSSRLQADFDNYRKRTNEDKKKLKDDAAAETVEKFLPVLDALNHGLAAIKDPGIAKGVEMIKRQFSDVLSAAGVSEIDALNQEFDPNLHNAVMQVPAENGEQPGTVAEVFSAGYILGSKVIRHSVVKVRS